MLVSNETYYTESTFEGKNFFKKVGSLERGAFREVYPLQWGHAIFDSRT